MADARGHYTVGKELVDSVVDRVRRVAGRLYPMPLTGTEFLTNFEQKTATRCRGS